MVVISNLGAEGPGLKQLIIAIIGLNQSALDTAFQYGGKHQALHRCNISAYHLHPPGSAGVDKGI